METKVCIKCHEAKDVSQFYPRHRPCKKCHNRDSVEKTRKRRDADPEKFKTYMANFQREARLKRPEVYRRAERSTKLKKYGKTHEWWQETFDKQGAVCAICMRPETTVDDRTGKVKSLAIDHDHTTNEVRGLLCVYCNTALHNVERSPNWPSRAAAYLKRFRPEPVEKAVLLPFDI